MLSERGRAGAADRHGHPAGHRGAAGHRLGGRRRGARAQRGRRVLGDRPAVGAIRGRCSTGIPMSTDRTGAAQLARLAALGLSVGCCRRCATSTCRPTPSTSPPATPGSASPAAPRADRRSGGADGRAALRPAFTGGRDAGRRSAVDALDLGRGPLERRRPTTVDLLVVSRCEPPVLDLGCGPGRMVVALESFRPLGPRRRHVGGCRGASMSRGGPALHRRISDSISRGRALGHRAADGQQRRHGRRPRGPARDAAATWSGPAA